MPDAVGQDQPQGQQHAEREGGHRQSQERPRSEDGRAIVGRLTGLGTLGGFVAGALIGWVVGFESGTGWLASAPFPFLAAGGAGVPALILAVALGSLLGLLGALGGTLREATLAPRDSAAHATPGTPDHAPPHGDAEGYARRWLSALPIYGALALVAYMGYTLLEGTRPGRAGHDRHDEHRIARHDAHHVGDVARGGVRRVCRRAAVQLLAHRARDEDGGHVRPEPPLAPWTVALAFTVAAVAWFAVKDLEIIRGAPPPVLEPAAGAAPDTLATTPNTVRLRGPNAYASAAAITQATYGGTQHEDRPHAVILARADREADAMLAAARVTHHPVNAPVLYVDADRLPPETFAELERLGPDGNTYDEGVKVYLVGPIAERVEREVGVRLGYKTRAFRVADPIASSEVLDTWAAAVHADHPDEVGIVQLHQLSTGLPLVTWNAHMGHGLAFVVGDTVPDATRRMLRRRFHQEAFIYLFGDTTIISAEVARELARYGHVQRIPGKDATEVSVNFARYRDAGLNQGHWIGWSTRDFGWGVEEPGHNFTLVNPDNWTTAVMGSLLSHLGKHGPMLLVPGASADTLPDVMARYLASVRPLRTAPADQLVNHGWILGDANQMSWRLQLAVDTLLEATRER